MFKPVTMVTNGVGYRYIDCSKASCQRKVFCGCLYPLTRKMLPLAQCKRLAVGLLAVLSGLLSTAECCLALLELNEFQHRRQIEECLRLISSERFRTPFQSNSRRRQQCCWTRLGRSDAWWENFTNGVVDRGAWLENFRMARENFAKLCDELRPFVQRQRLRPSRARSCVSVEKQVAMTLYYLSDEG